MKAKPYLISTILVAGMLSCFGQAKQPHNVVKNFLKKYPKHTLKFLDSLSNFDEKYLNSLDTIDPNFLRELPPKEKPPYKLIDKLDYDPIYGIQSPCNTKAVAIIPIENECFILISLQKYHGFKFIFTTLNKYLTCISALGMEYDGSQKRNYMPLAYPEYYDDKSFLLTNIMAEELINSNMDTEKWWVRINSDGMLHVVWLRSDWGTYKAEGSIKVGKSYITTRSIYEFRINDKDGYSNLRLEPNTNGKVIEKINDNELVTVCDINKNWWQVKSRAGNIGYVHKSRIKCIEKKTNVQK